MEQTIFITGTDTGVGKTVLTALLLRFLREHGVNAAALKPVCSGGRGDARKLAAAMNGALELDEINPWHFRAPIAPLLSARRERKHLHPPEVLAHVRAMQKKFDMLLIEGAGGLLSPLGENFDSGDLIAALGAVPLIVAPTGWARSTTFCSRWRRCPAAPRSGRALFWWLLQNGTPPPSPTQSCSPDFSTPEEFSQCRGWVKHFPPKRS